jgi:hypothetical protein
MSLVLTAFPFATYLFLKKFQTKMETLEFKKKFESLYDSTSTKKDSAIILIPFFLFRRFILAVSIVFVADMVCV